MNRSTQQICILFMTTLAGSTSAQFPVPFQDVNLKMAVGDALGIWDPAPADMLALTEFNASSLGIADLTGLEYASNLQTLDMRYNQIRDIGPLSGCSHLQTLILNNNRISNLSPLSGLGELRRLDIHYNPISNLTVLAGLSTLEELTLHNMQIGDISALSSLIHLRSLDLYNNQISDLSALARLSQLQHLYMGDNRISDLAPLAGLTRLETLSAPVNQICEISVLSGLVNLRSLHLFANGISDISALSGLTRLRFLDLTSNPLNEEACGIYIPRITANNPGISFLHNPCLSCRLVTSSTGGGSVINPGEGVFTYKFGTEILVWAKADPGFIFSHWSSSSSSTLNPIYIKMDLDHEIQAHFRSLLTTLHVDDDTPGDPLENGSANHPFDSIQEAIDVAPNGATVLVRPGTYTEDIDLLGKSIHLTGLDPNIPLAMSAYPVITGSGSGPIVRLASNEDPNCRIRGLVFSQSKALPTYALYCSKASPSIDHCLIVGNRTSASNGAAVYCLNSQALFDHCTFADNLAGAQGAGLVLVDSNVTITHSILWGNAPQDLLLTGTSLPTITYTDLTGRRPGLGIIDGDPLFAGPGYWADPEDPNRTMAPTDPRAVWMVGDYHLRSQAGRWDGQTKTWVLDDGTSPCIDAGDPDRPMEDEPLPNGGLLNLGAYGGTAQASRSNVVNVPVYSSNGTYPNKVRASWEPVCNGPSYASYYKVSRASSQDGPKTPVSPWQIACAFDDTSALAGTPYFYWAQSASSNSGSSASGYSDVDIGSR